MSRNVHEAAVAAVTPLAHGVVEWRLRAAEPIAFRGGQFISVRVGIDEDQNPILRSYSIASLPSEPELGLVLKLVPGGAGSDFFARLRVGDLVHFTGPMGFFVVELAHPGDVIIGATSVGIAPVLPMLDEMLRRPENGRVDLFWGNRDAADLFWQRELAALPQGRLHIRRFLSGDAPADWAGERGRITAPLVAAARAATKPTVYLVGNGAMIADAKKELVAAGLDRRRQVRTESFFV